MAMAGLAGLAGAGRLDGGGGGARRMGELEIGDGNGRHVVIPPPPLLFILTNLCMLALVDRPDWLFLAWSMDAH